MTLNGLTGLKPAVSTDAGLKVQRTYCNTPYPYEVDEEDERHLRDEQVDPHPNPALILSLA